MTQRTPNVEETWTKKRRTKGSLRPNPWWESTLLDVSRRGAQSAIDELLDHKLTPRFRLGEDGDGQRLVFVRIVSSRTGSSLFPIGHGHTAGLALMNAIDKMRADLGKMRADLGKERVP